MPQIDCQFDVNGEFRGVSKKSVSNIYCFCREVCDLELNKKQCQLGGEGKIVEVDESNFKIRKYHRGRKKEGQWVLGAVERAEGDQKSTAMKFILVPDRSQETLLSILATWCRPVRSNTF